jgi:CRISPR-associated endoribonuclease Cas6
MRLLIRLAPLKEAAFLPLDNYPLAGLIYRSVSLTAPDYAEFLHAEGFPAQGAEPHRPEHKRFKFFVFSRIEQRGKRIANGRQWLSDCPVEWKVASPLDELIQLLAAGLIAQGTVSIGDHSGVCDFGVSEIIELRPPRIKPQMKFKTLSPVFVSVAETGAEGARTKQHLRADDSRFAERVRLNLLSKYRALTGTEPNDAALHFCFEGQPKAQLVQYRGTHHHCYLGNFSVSGSAELMRLGLDCGFGEANSKGFGMAEYLYTARDG